MESYAPHNPGLTRHPLFIISLLFYCHAGITDELAESRQHAMNILASHVMTATQEAAAVYALNTPVTGGQLISSWTRKIQVPGQFGRAWFYFIDDMPGANWEHSCRYVFIDYDSDNFEILKGSTPPDNLDDMMRIFIP